MFPTTITVNNIADLQKVMSVLYPTTGVTEITDKSRDVGTNTAEVAAAPVEKPSAKPSPKATGAKAEAQSAPSSPTAEAAGAGAATQSTEQAAPTTGTAPTATANSASDTPAPTKEEAATAITSLVKTKGRAVAVEVLAAFGAATLSDVKSEKYAELIAAAKAAMGG